MDQPSPTTHRRSKAIRTTDLTKQYQDGESDVVALDRMDLEVKRGEVFGFLGPNGAGKSTTINILLGLSEPTSGSARVLGYHTQGETVPLRQRIGVLPEGLGLYERLTGRRHVEFALEWKDADDDLQALIDRVGLDERTIDRPVAQYSKGMRQRLALALALVGSPEVLILDEPSSGLDPHGIRRLRAIVRAERDRGATVFFSSHLLDQVEAVCDRVGILLEGKLVDVDTVEGLRQTVGRGKELELRVEAPVDTDLLSIAGVDAVSQTDGLLRVETSEATAKARVVERLTRAGITIQDIDSTEVSLEDVFTAYTGDSALGPIRSIGHQQEVPAR